VEHAAYISVIRANAASLAAAVTPDALDVAIPSCPRWTLQRLVAHLGNHYVWVGHNLDRPPGAGMFPAADLPGPPPPTGLNDWLLARAAALTDKLEAVGPEHVCWTWTADRHSRFWARRSAHETVMHAWDGLNAVGARPVIESAVAADGIAEYLDVVPAGFWTDAPPTGDDDRIRLIAADAARAWTVHVDGDGMRVTNESPESRGSDVTVRGTAADLLLHLMGRVPADTLTWSGDASVFRRWHTQVEF
jgi:uncharacterized protein (TIGR03083 family)